MVPQFLGAVAVGGLHVKAVPVPLADIADAWQRDAQSGSRLVVVPAGT